MTTENRDDLIGELRDTILGICARDKTQQAALKQQALDIVTSIMNGGEQSFFDVYNCLANLFLELPGDKTLINVYHSIRDFLTKSCGHIRDPDKRDRVKRFVELTYSDVYEQFPDTCSKPFPPWKISRTRHPPARNLKEWLLNAVEEIFRVVLTNYEYFVKEEQSILSNVVSTVEDLSAKLLKETRIKKGILEKDIFKPFLDILNRLSNLADENSWEFAVPDDTKIKYSKEEKWKPHMPYDEAAAYQLPESIEYNGTCIEILIAAACFNIENGEPTSPQLAHGLYVASIMKKLAAQSDRDLSEYLRGAVLINAMNSVLENGIHPELEEHLPFVKAHVGLLDSYTGSFVLRPHQERMIEQLVNPERNALGSTRGTVNSSPTGSGKTYAVVSVCKRAQKSGVVIIYSCSVPACCKDILNRLQEEDVPVAMIREGQCIINYKCLFPRVSKNSRQRRDQSNKGGRRRTISNVADRNPRQIRLPEPIRAQAFITDTHPDSARLLETILGERENAFASLILDEPTQKASQYSVEGKGLTTPEEAKEVHADIEFAEIIHSNPRINNVCFLGATVPDVFKRHVEGLYGECEDIGDSGFSLNQRIEIQISAENTDGSRVKLINAVGNASLRRMSRYMSPDDILEWKERSIGDQKLALHYDSKNVFDGSGVCNALEEKQKTGDWTTIEPDQTLKNIPVTIESISECFPTIPNHGNQILSCTDREVSKLTGELVSKLPIREQVQNNGIVFHDDGESKDESSGVEAESIADIWGEVRRSLLQLQSNYRNVDYNLEKKNKSLPTNDPMRLDNIDASKLKKRALYENSTVVQWCKVFAEASPFSNWSYEVVYSILEGLLCENAEICREVVDDNILGLLGFNLYRNDRFSEFMMNHCRVTILGMGEMFGLDKVFTGLYLTTAQASVMGSDILLQLFGRLARTENTSGTVVCDLDAARKTFCDVPESNMLLEEAIRMREDPKYASWFEYKEYIPPVKVIDPKRIAREIFELKNLKKILEKLLELRADVERKTRATKGSCTNRVIEWIGKIDEAVLCKDTLPSTTILSSRDAKTNNKGCDERRMNPTFMEIKLIALVCFDMMKPLGLLPKWIQTHMSTHPDIILKVYKSDPNPTASSARKLIIEEMSRTFVECFAPSPKWEIVSQRMAQCARLREALGFKRESMITIECCKKLRPTTVVSFLKYLCDMFVDDTSEEPSASPCSINELRAMCIASKKLDLPQAALPPIVVELCLNHPDGSLVKGAVDEKDLIEVKITDLYKERGEGLEKYYDEGGVKRPDKVLTHFLIEQYTEHHKADWTTPFTALEHGTVKFYNTDKGFGYISRDGKDFGKSGDINVSSKDLGGCQLASGDDVTFYVEERRVGQKTVQCAVEITVKPLKVYSGVIVTLNSDKQFGFIKPNAAAKKALKTTENFHFKFSTVRSTSTELRRRDTVSFSLGKMDKVVMVMAAEKC